VSEGGIIWDEPESRHERDTLVTGCGDISTLNLALGSSTERGQVSRPLDCRELRQHFGTLFPSRADE